MFREICRGVFFLGILILLNSVTHEDVRGILIQALIGTLVAILPIAVYLAVRLRE